MPETESDIATTSSLFVLRNRAMEPLEPSMEFPNDFHDTLQENLQLFLGERPITLGTWGQADHPDRPSILGFDTTGSLVAVILSDGSDDTATRISAAVEWVNSLNLRDVLKMPSSVDALMDALLAQNPNELHLTLAPTRRVVLVQLVDSRTEPAIFDGVSEVVHVELFAGVGGATILCRVAPQTATSAVARSSDPVVVGDPVEGSPEAETEVSSEADSETETDAKADTPSPELSGVVPAATVIDVTDEALAKEPLESSLAPPPQTRNTAVDAAIEPGAVSFKPGTPMRTDDLAAYLNEKTGSPETVVSGCVTSGKHVLITDLLSHDNVLQSRGHYHRPIDDEHVDRFRDWYDGSIPKVTFHLLVQSEDRPEETTYVGRLKPTAWEHRSGKQTLLFRIVPRVATDLWLSLSAGEVPTIPPEAAADEPEPWPVVPAKEVEPTPRRRGVRRYR